MSVTAQWTCSSHYLYRSYRAEVVTATVLSSIQEGFGEIVDEGDSACLFRAIPALCCQVQFSGAPQRGSSSTQSGGRLCPSTWQGCRSGAAWRVVSEAAAEVTGGHWS